MDGASTYFGKHTECFAALGALSASYVALKLLLSLWRGMQAFLLAGSLGLSTNLKKMGEWAVVTGATDGIGKAYAQQLANMGMNIVLISRNPDKLSDVAAEISKASQIKTKCIAVDFTGGPEIYAKIKTELTGVEVGVLVNNVGMSSSYPDYFGEFSQETMRNILTVNTSSVVEMTMLVLHGMLQRRKGVIINISSASSLVPTPMLSLYAATKSFVNSFSHALQTEYASNGIIVQCVMPFFVATKLSKIRKTNVLVPSPTTFVRSALATVGVERSTFGCAAHALQAYVISRIPECIVNYIALSQMKATRSRALKRKSKEN